MRAYEVVAECIIGGVRRRPGELVQLSEEQVRWGRRARVIGREIAAGGDDDAPVTEEPKKKGKRKG